MNLEKERELFDQWVLKHPDNLDITKYEENIMFDAWIASASREGYKMVPVEPSKEIIKSMLDAYEEHLSEGMMDAYKAMIGAVE